MVYRRDLVEHFEWLAGSEHYDDTLDEALVAIALCAHGHCFELVSYGAAWMTADGVVEVLGLDPFVEKARADHVLFGRGSPGPQRGRYADIP